jgi:hypothetical protein
MTGWRLWPTSQRATIPEPEVVDAIREVKSNMAATPHYSDQHECIRPTADNWHPGIMWTCLRCGDVWVFLHRGRWARTDLNLHSFRQRLPLPEQLAQQYDPTPPPAEPEWGVRTLNGGASVDMRTQDRVSAEELANSINRVSQESQAEVIMRWPGGSWTTAGGQQEEQPQPVQLPHPNEEVFAPQDWFSTARPPGQQQFGNGYMPQQARA